MYITLDILEWKEAGFGYKRLTSLCPVPLAQCTLHHTCEVGRRSSHPEREGGMLGLRLPPVRDNSPPVMDNILQEVTAIRHFLEKRDRCREVAKEWLQVGYVLDVLLFRVYMVAVVTYSITLGTLWSVWQVAWAVNMNSAGEVINSCHCSCCVSAIGSS